MKRVYLPVKIGLLMILAVTILSAAGYLSYRNISSIVSSINVDVQPDLRLLTIREISLDLEKAENSIRMYSITNDSVDLQPYFNTVSGINQKVARLRNECRYDSLLLRQTDTIRKLIRQNMVIWSEILNLSQDDKLSEDIRSLSDSLIRASANALKPEQGIFKKSSRKYKSPIDEVELISNLSKIEEQDRITREKMLSRITQLAVNGNKIREKFYDLIAKMEFEVRENISRKALEADQMAAMTYRWLGLFCLSGTILAILVMFIIIRYVRKTHAYQIALEDAKVEAENLSSTKELFMANISHEIRTPVTAISGFTDQLLHEQLDEYTANTLKIIKSSSDHLRDIINDILDFSKLQNNKLALEKVHFSILQVINDVYDLFERQAAAGNTTLSWSLSPETPPVLFGDPYRLKQIMINLVSNAVKFTSNGKVHFSVKASKTKKGELELVIEVIDTGIGIEENKLNMIFEDFTQAEMSTTRKYGGTGLGLSIVKKLVELHNGKIDCSSRKNFGTHITCYLPYLPGDEKQVEKEKTEPLSIPEYIRNTRILIVDDEEYNRLLFKTILKRWGIAYSEATNGAEAIEQVKNQKFDLVFMDARMPVIDGLKATRFIREELKVSSDEMPVICISAASVNDEWEKYEKAGMNAFLEKPFTEMTLMNAIMQTLSEAPRKEINIIQVEKQTAKGNDSRINLESLFRISGEDKQFARQMLSTFLETTTKGLAEMNDAFAAGEMKIVGEIAHRLIPPCRHIGVSVLLTLLRKIDEGTRGDIDKESVEALIKESCCEFEIIKDLVNGEIAKIN